MDISLAVLLSVLLSTAVRCVNTINGCDPNHYSYKDVTKTGSATPGEHVKEQ